MDNLELKGNWHILAGKLKQTWANLTDDDLAYQDGKSEELLGNIQKKTGQTKDQLTNWLRRNSH